MNVLWELRVISVISRKASMFYFLGTLTNYTILDLKYDGFICICILSTIPETIQRLYFIYSYMKLMFTPNWNQTHPLPKSWPQQTILYTYIMFPVSTLHIVVSREDSLAHPNDTRPQGNMSCCRFVKYHLHHHSNTIFTTYEVWSWCKTTLISQSQLENESTVIQFRLIH